MDEKLKAVLEALDAVADKLDTFIYFSELPKQKELRNALVVLRDNLAAALEEK